MEKSGTWFPDCFHLNALMGDDIGRSLLAATYKGFSCCQGGQRAAGNMAPVISYSVILLFSVCLIHLKF